MKKMKHIVKKFRIKACRLIPLSLVSALILGLFTATDIYYDEPAEFEVNATELNENSIENSIETTISDNSYGNNYGNEETFEFDSNDSENTVSVTTEDIIHNESFEILYEEDEVKYMSDSSISMEKTSSGEDTEGTLGFDSSIWYQSTVNHVTWNYKLNGNGDIIGLYTEDSIVPIVDGGGTLNIPSKVAGRTVIGVGGGTEATPLVPSAETSWTNISFPSTVTTINDYGFFQTKAMANIVIPEHITDIGIKAFYQSSIVGVKVNEMNGTIGSLAFGANQSLSNVTLKGGKSGLTVSTSAFRDSNTQSITVKGKVNIHKHAFKNNTRLINVNISGNVDIGEYAFNDCTSVNSLIISGTTKINSYAFNNLVSLTELYLPEGTILEEYAFNGCSSLAKLESDINLVNHAFEGCGKITTLVLGENVQKVEYDWEGHAGSYPSRKVYVKNKNTDFEFYKNEGNYISSFGSTGNIIVYVLNDASVDQGPDMEAAGNILRLKGYTCYAHKGNYADYITGKASSVILYSINNIKTQMGSDGVTEMQITSSNVQTGIEAYYTGTILTTKNINKKHMTVIPVYGSDEGDSAYKTDAFYILRTTDFNALENINKVTEDEVASYEPVQAKAEDLDAGQDIGTISVTVIVFYENDEGLKKYFSTPVTIRVEEYNSKSYVEQEYGSYENIAEVLATLTDRVKELEAEISDLKENNPENDEKVTQLQEELNTYKKAYEDLVKLFADFVTSNKTDESGYFGTITDAAGNSNDVVYIEGNPIIYENTVVITPEGKPIYTAEYDTDKDGIKEIIYFYVDSEGVHLTDVNGNSTGTVYTDTLGVIERETTAKLLEIKKSLDFCITSLAKIIEALEDAGYDFDDDLSIDEQYRQVLESIQNMAEKMGDLETELANANNSINGYENALASIYSLLTGSTLKADDISGINNTLNAIINKIQTLQNSLKVAQATVKDLQNQLDVAESAYSELETELNTTKTQLAQANTALLAAQSEKETLVQEYEKAMAEGDEKAAAALQSQINEKQAAIDRLTATQAALEQKEQDIIDAQNTISSLQKQIESKNAEIADLQKQLNALGSSADGFALTVGTANEIFGLTLKSNASNEDIYNAIVAYVQDKVVLDQTISGIQVLINSSNTGDALVQDVKTAINNQNTSNTNMIDDSIINIESHNYKMGYNAGYVEGIKVNGGGNNSSDSSTITELSSKVSSLTSENTKLKKEVSDLEDEVDDLEDEINDLRYNNRELSNKVTTLGNNAVGSTNTANTSTTNVNVDEKVENLIKTNESLVSEVASLKSQLNKVTSTSKSTVTTTSKTKEDVKEDKTEQTEKTETTVKSNVTTTESKPDVMVTGTLTNVEKVVGLGSVVQLNIADVKDSSAASNQKGTGVVVKLPENGSVVSTINTNGSEANAVSVDSINNAYDVMGYYADHLYDLGSLGSEEIKSASKNASKAVILETIVSTDIEPSPTQAAAIKNGVTTKVNVSFDGIDNNSLYLIIHESEKRAGIYDITMVKPKNGILGFDLADLSPVTIAKVSLENISDIDLAEQQNVESMEEPDDENSNGGFRTIVYILIILAVLIGLGVIAYIKLKGSPFIKEDDE